MQNEEIKKLAQKLQRFPLALQQAVAYIKERDRELKNIRKKYNISDYLKNMKKKQKNYLIVNFQKRAAIHTPRQHL